MSDQITPILMPKWGLSMKEGTLAAWHVNEGDHISVGDEIMDVESDKIANAVEAPDEGLLRRRVGQEGAIYPVQALLGVMAPESVSNADIGAYIDAYKMPEPEEDDSLEPAYEFADLNPGRIRYIRRGQGATPVILIHGFGGDLNNWLFNIDVICEQAQTYALDLPGHGQSVKSIENPDLGTMIQTVTEFMDYQEIDKAHLIGHSMGGLISGQMAIEKPERVAALTLIGSAGFGKEINADYIDGFVHSSTRKTLKPVLKALFADEKLVNRSMVDDLLKYKRLDGVEPFLAALKANLFSDGRQAKEIASGFNSLSIPRQIIWGEHDAIIPSSHANSIKGVETTLIEGAGHMVHMEAATRVNDLIKGLI